MGSSPPRRQRCPRHFYGETSGWEIDPDAGYFTPCGDDELFGFISSLRDRPLTCIDCLAWFAKERPNIVEFK